VLSQSSKKSVCFLKSAESAGNLSTNQATDAELGRWLTPSILVAVVHASLWLEAMGFTLLHFGFFLSLANHLPPLNGYWRESHTS